MRLAAVDFLADELFAADERERAGAFRVVPLPSSLSRRFSILVTRLSSGSRLRSRFWTSSMPLVNAATRSLSCFAPGSSVILSDHLFALIGEPAE